MFASIVLPLIAFAALLLVAQRLWPAWGSPSNELACSRCGGRHWRRGRCASCGLDSDSPLASDLADLAATERQLRRFRMRAAIDETMAVYLQQLVSGERSRLLRESAPPTRDPRPQVVTLQQGADSVAGRSRLAVKGLIVASLVAGLALGVGTALAGGSGWAFVFVAVACGGLAEWLWRKELQNPGNVLGFAGLVFGLASVLAAGLPAHGFKDPGGASAVCAIGAMVGLTLNRRWQFPAIHAIGLGVGAVATVWAGRWLWPQSPPAWSTILTLEAAAWAALIQWRGGSMHRSLRDSLQASALGLAGVAILGSVFAAWVAPGWTVSYVLTAGLLGLCSFTIGIGEQRVWAVRAAGCCVALAFLAATGWLGSVAADLSFMPARVNLFGLGTGVGAVLLVVIAGRASAASKRIWSQFRAWRDVAVVCALLATGLGILGSLGEPSLSSATITVLVAFTAMALASQYARRRAALFALGQGLCLVAIVLGATAVLVSQSWFVGHPWGSAGRFLDPWAVETYGISLSLACLLCLATRSLLPVDMWEPGRRYLEAPTRFLLALSVGFVCVVAAIAGLRSELGSGNEGIFSEHAFGTGGLVFYASVVAVLWCARPENQKRAATAWLVPILLLAPLLVSGFCSAPGSQSATLAWIWAAMVAFATVSRRAQTPAIPRALIGAAAIPLIVLSFARTASLAGLVSRGAIDGPLGPTTTLIGPLLLVAVSLAWRGWRRHDECDLSGAGLLMAYGVIAAHLVLSSRDGVDGLALTLGLVKSTAIGCALWVLAWLLLLGTQGGIRNPKWLRVQLSIACGGNAVLFGGSLALLLLAEKATWIRATGSPSAGAALASLTAAVAFAQSRGRLSGSENCFGWLGLGLLAFFGSLAHGVDPTSGTKCMLFGSALLALGWAYRLRIGDLRGDWIATAGRNAVAWTLAHGTIAILFAIKALQNHDLLGAAATLLILAVAALTASQGLLRECWTLTAGLGLACSSILFMCGLWRNQSLADWWIYPLQVGAVIGATFSIAWQAVLRRAGKEQPGQVQAYTVLWIASITAPALAAAGSVILSPVHLEAPFRALGNPLGWLAFGLTLLSAARLRSLPWTRACTWHAVGLSALCLGVSVTCAGAAAFGWPPANLLMCSWMLAAAALFVGGSNGLPLSEHVARRWTVGFGAVVELLAFANAVQNPDGRVWSITAACGTLLIAVGLAVRTQRLGYVFLVPLLTSGLVSLLWSLAEHRSLETFLSAQALSSAASGLMVLCLPRLSRRHNDSEIVNPSHAVQTVCTVVTLALLLALALDYSGWSHGSGVLSPVLAGLAIVCSAAGNVWHRRERESSSQVLSLYLLGWIALQLGTRTAGPTVVACALALFGATYTALCARIARANATIPKWFLVGQMAATSVIIALTLSVSLDSTLAWYTRFTGSIALGLLSMAVLWMAAACRTRARMHPPAATEKCFAHLGLFLPALAACEFGWGLMWPSSAIAFLPVTMFAVLYCKALPRRISLSSPWSECCRTSGLVLACLAGVLAVGASYEFLTAYGIAFFDHPQTWLIPPALVILAFVYSGRDRLSFAQRSLWTGLPCFAVYATSTAEMFKAGLSNSPDLPALLGGLALGGLVTGLRAGLPAVALQGGGGLVLSGLVLIYHFGVAQHHTWVLLASAAALGAVLFVARKSSVPFFKAFRPR